MGVASRSGTVSKAGLGAGAVRRFGEGPRGPKGRAEMPTLSLLSRFLMYSIVAS
jgi:hypothetical protein